MSKVKYVNNLLAFAKVVGLSDDEIAKIVGPDPTDNARQLDRANSEKWFAQRAKPAPGSEDEALLKQTGARKIEEARLIVRINQTQTPYTIASLCSGSATKLVQQTAVDRIQDLVGFSFEDFKDALNFKGLRRKKIVYQSIVKKMVSVIETFDQSVEMLKILKKIQSKERYREDAKVYENLEPAVIEKMLKYSTNNDQLFIYFKNAVEICIEPDISVFMQLAKNIDDSYFYFYFKNNFLDTLDRPRSVAAIEIVKESPCFNIKRQFLEYVDSSAVSYFDDVIMQLLAVAETDSDMARACYYAFYEYFKKRTPELYEDFGGEKFLENFEARKFIKSVFEKIASSDSAYPGMKYAEKILDLAEYLDNADYQSEFKDTKIVIEKLSSRIFKENVLKLVENIDRTSRRPSIDELYITEHYSFETDQAEFAKQAVIELLNRVK